MKEFIEYHDSRAMLTPKLKKSFTNPYVVVSTSITMQMTADGGTSVWASTANSFAIGKCET